MDQGFKWRESRTQWYNGLKRNNRIGRIKLGLHVGGRVKDRIWRVMNNTENLSKKSYENLPTGKASIYLIYMYSIDT